MAGSGVMEWNGSLNVQQESDSGNGIEECKSISSDCFQSSLLEIQKCKNFYTDSQT